MRIAIFGLHGDTQASYSPDQWDQVWRMAHDPEAASAARIFEAHSEPIARKYIVQMQWQMACTGRQWCDFASYDPRMPEAMRLFVKRVPRDGEMIAQLEKDVTDFLNELRLTVHRLRAKYEPETIMAGELLVMAG